MRSVVDAVRCRCGSLPTRSVVDVVRCRCGPLSTWSVVDAVRCRRVSVDVAAVSLAVLLSVEAEAGDLRHPSAEGPGPRRRRWEGAAPGPCPAGLPLAHRGRQQGLHVRRPPAAVLQHRQQRVDATRTQRRTGYDDDDGGRVRRSAADDVRAGHGELGRVAGERADEERERRRADGGGGGGAGRGVGGDADGRARRQQAEAGHVGRAWDPGRMRRAPTARL